MLTLPDFRLHMPSITRLSTFIIIITSEINMSGTHLVMMSIVLIPVAVFIVVTIVVSEKTRRW